MGHPTGHHPVFLCWTRRSIQIFRKIRQTKMKKTFPGIAIYLNCLILTAGLTACAGDPLQSGLDPFAPMVFKEGATTMPLNPPNQATLLPFYVSQHTIFKFAVDTDSILIGADGVTRYIVVMKSPSGNEQTQYEGIRCDSFQWRLYGTLEKRSMERESSINLAQYSKQCPKPLSSLFSPGRILQLQLKKKILKIS